MKKCFLLFLYFLCVSSSFSQKKVAHNNLVWVGDFTTLKLNDRWSLYFDFGLRRTDWLSRWSQVVARPGLTYHFNKNVSATAGLAYFSHYSVNYIRPEGRGWQQLLFSDTYGRAKVSHRLRSEQRFFLRVAGGQPVSGYNYNNRFRYQLSLQVALNHKELKDKTLFFYSADEIFINSGKEIAANYFDQNRFSVGLGFKWTDKFIIQLSYMNDFIQRAKADSFDKNNVLVINLYHGFERIKKKKAH